MKLKTFFVINAIFSCFFGLSSIFFPSKVMILYEIGVTPAVSLLAQYSGLGSIVLGMVPWFSRNMDLDLARKTIIPALLISNLIGVIISVLSFVSGTMKLGLLTAGLYFIFAVGYFFFQFSKTKTF